MGMFDTVNFEMYCLECNSKVVGFQSKDSHCGFNFIDPSEVSNFYASCPKCKVWIEFIREELPAEKARSTPFTLDEIEEMGFNIVKRK